MNKPRKNGTGSRVNNNGSLELTEQLEAMRLQVIDLEYKARYWKAQYEIRYYNLQAEKLQPEYDSYLEAQKLKNEELRAKMVEEIEKARKEMIEKGEIPGDDITPVDDSNSSL